MKAGELLLSYSSLPSGNTAAEHFLSITLKQVIEFRERQSVKGQSSSTVRNQSLVTSNSVHEINNALRRVATSSDRFVTELDSVTNKVGRLQAVVDSLLRKSGQ